MASRAQLQATLGALADDVNVYFQPKSNIELQYPAIVYVRDPSITRFANNAPYKRFKRYLVTVIDRDPDSVIPDKVADLPMCTHNRFFAADSLNHDVFNLYF